jgi:thymidylate synthase
MSLAIPVIKVEGKTLPEVWEKAVLGTWERGLALRTEYDKPGDPPSRDCTMIMVVEEPFCEPRIHRAFPGSLEDLEVYRQEVVAGVHDHWIRPEEGKWTYTYHQRLFSFHFGIETINQVGYIIDKLSRVPYTRRAQAITWDPSRDPKTDDPPCLQRIWCRLVAHEDERYALTMNTHWRSRDAYKASFMNIYALTDLQRFIAEEISKRIDAEVAVARYVDISDSFHIYGSYVKEFENFLNLISKRSFEERTWATKFAQPFFDDAKRRLLEESGMPNG